MEMNADVQLSPSKRRGLGLRQLFQSIIDAKKKKLPSVGGNLLFFIPNVATWTIVTQGPNPRILDYAADEEVNFAIKCEDEILMQLLTGNVIDLKPAIDSKKIELIGDRSILSRFLALMD